jgi:hypothetical protein
LIKYLISHWIISTIRYLVYLLARHLDNPSNGIFERPLFLRYKQTFNTHKLKAKASIDAQEKQIKRRLRTQKTVATRDKYAFVLGVTSVWFIPSLMFTHPNLVPLYFSVCGFLLIGTLTPLLINLRSSIYALQISLVALFPS